MATTDSETSTTTFAGARKAVGDGLSLGGAEGWLATADKGAFRVCLRLCLSGSRITTAAVESALAHLQARHPLLRSTVHPDPMSLIEVPDLKIPVVEKTLPGSSATVDEVSAVADATWVTNQTVPWLPGSPFLTVFLVHSAEPSTAAEPTELLLAMEHSVCDGFSISHVGHELLQHLAGDPSVPTTPLTLVPSYEDMHAACFPSASSISHPSPGPTTAAIRSSSASTTDAHVQNVILSLTKDQTQRLVDACKAHGVTVTAAILAAYNTALARTLLQSEPLKTSDALSVCIAFSVSARKLFTPKVANDNLAFLSGGLRPEPREFKAAEEASWFSEEALWEAAKVSKEDLSHARNGEELFQTYTMGSTAVVSQWGVLPFTESYGTAEDAPAFSLTSVTPLCNVELNEQPTMFVSTTNGVMTFVQACRSTLDVDGQVRPATEALVEGLLCMCGSA